MWSSLLLHGKRGLIQLACYHFFNPYSDYSSWNEKYGSIHLRISGLQGLFNIASFLSGLVLMFFLGIKQMSQIVGFLVPVMTVFYIVDGVVIICLRIEGIQELLTLIFKSAFRSK